MQQLLHLSRLRFVQSFDDVETSKQFRSTCRNVTSGSRLRCKFLDVLIQVVQADQQADKFARNELRPVVVIPVQVTEVSGV